MILYINNLPHCVITVVNFEKMSYGYDLFHTSIIERVSIYGTKALVTKKLSIHLFSNLRLFSKAFVQDAQAAWTKAFENNLKKQYRM